MLSDIKTAKKYIYLETYHFGNDEIGKKFRKELMKKSNEGVEIKLLMDGFGSAFRFRTAFNKDFLKHFFENGINVKLYREFRFGFNIIRKNNYRDHRKLLVIDDRISYIGSSNINSSCLSWKESNIRIEGRIAVAFRNIFQQNYKIANKYSFKKESHLKLLNSDGIRIIRDIPSMDCKIRDEQLNMISSANKEILIETPYFLPDKQFRNELIAAAKRGVKVMIIMPLDSDHKIADYLREKNLGELNLAGIEIYYYKYELIHAKVMVVDKKVYSIGSSNLDFRSTLFQFEMNILGNISVIKDII